ncbi:hypothetical protein [Winogradskya consettensis]|nr:hypothetical protein [Actinoplanes consettensis]
MNIRWRAQQISLCGRYSHMRFKEFMARRRFWITVVAGLALIGVVFSAAVVRVRADAAPPASSSTHPRGPGQLTVRAAADSPYTWNRGTTGSLQWMQPDGQAACCAEVRVYDPGTYDSQALESGERITVAGHQAYSATTDVKNLSGAADRVSKMPTVGWQDKSGEWVTVVNIDSVSARKNPGTDLLTGIAKYVEIGAPADVEVPMHFPAVPGALPLKYVNVGDGTATLGFGGDATRTPWPLQVQASAKGSPDMAPSLRGAPNTTVAGRPAYYFEKSGSMRVPAGGSGLAVEIDTCAVQVTVADRTEITRDDLEKMFEGATFDRCD